MTSSADALPSIAILGGTGALGMGLAARWARAGHRVILGSRTPEKAVAAAAGLASDTSGAVSGASNVEAVADADVVVVAVPYSNHAAILAEVRDAARGKIVVDAAVPLQPPKVSVVHLPPEGSAAVAAQRILGEGVRVTSAFHNVSAGKLREPGPIECDILVFGDDREARETVVALVGSAGLRGVDGGALANSVAAEAMTAVLIGINRRHKVPGAGIRITGLPQDEPTASP
jgi:NADPH-dependent F420 reductase